MDNIHDNGNPQTMSCIDKLLKLIRCTETGRSGKKAGNMITETSIVRMLLDSHDLNTVITFVNQQRISRRFKCFFLKLKRLFRIPNLCTEDLCVFILNHSRSPSRNTFSLSAFPIYNQFIKITVLNGICRQIDFPIAIFQTFQAILLFFFPIIKCTNHINMGCIGCPFAESPSFICTMQTEIQISRSKVR